LQCKLSFAMLQHSVVYFSCIDLVLVWLCNRTFSAFGKVNSKKLRLPYWQVGPCFRTSLSFLNSIAYSGTILIFVFKKRHHFRLLLSM
jgi:hypothetical protein